MPLGSAPISIGAGPRLEALYFFLQHREGQLLSVFPLFFYLFTFRMRRIHPMKNICRFSIQMFG